MKKMPAARGDDFAPAYAKAMQAAEYVKKMPKIPAPLKTKPKAKPRPKFKQYGDKGYEPSNGLGVGH